MLRRIAVRTLVSGLALAAVLAGAEAASAASFAPAVKLVGASGGEPSIITDPLGDVFVSGPQGIPAGAGGGVGVGFWASHNGGATFGTAQRIGSQAGGGDSDLLFSKGAVYVADLEAAAAQVCKSVDRGATFNGIGPAPDPGHCTTINGGQTGPSDDREWLTGAPDGTLYLTYHEFVSAQPVAYRSDNGGLDGFSNACGPLVSDPAIEQNIPTDVTGGTLVSKPVTDAAGNLYVIFTTTTQDQNAAATAQGQPSGTFSQIYLAVSKDKCQSFTDYTVFDGEGKYGVNKVQFGDIFNDLAIDGAGNLYTVAAGFVNTPSNTSSLYLLSSRDGGQHWTAPRNIGPAGSAYMMPAAVTGPRAGQLAVGYFRTINGVTDPNSTSAKWTYSVAESGDATSATPTFSSSEPLAGADFHNGDICNLGILCTSGDRSLADFTSAAIDPSGCPLFSFAGNPTGSAGNNDSTNTFNYVARQTAGCFSTSSGQGGSSPTGVHKKPKPHHRSKPKPHHRKKPKPHHRKRPHARVNTDPDRDHDVDRGGQP